MSPASWLKKAGAGSRFFFPGSQKPDVSLVTVKPFNRQGENLPFYADFEGLEQALSIPATDLSKDISGSLMTARHNVFRTWAAQDPAAAANYILNHADRIEPVLMGTVIESVVQKDATAGVEWLQNLPDGPFLDQAINYTFAHIAQTDVGYGPAKELAGLISDATLREERLAWIEARRAQHR